MSMITQARTGSYAGCAFRKGESVVVAPRGVVSGEQHSVPCKQLSRGHQCKRAIALGKITVLGMRLIILEIPLRHAGILIGVPREQNLDVASHTDNNRTIGITQEDRDMQRGCPQYRDLRKVVGFITGTSTGREYTWKPCYV